MNTLVYHNPNPYRTKEIKKPFNFFINNSRFKSTKINRLSLTEDNYIFHKNPKEYNRSKQRDLNEEIDILCINCMKMIKPSLITKHSIECSQVKNEVKIMEQSSILNQIDYKIRKLKESLSQFKVNKEFDDDLFEALYKHCNDALIITSSTAIDILNCRRVISELDAIIKI